MKKRRNQIRNAPVVVAVGSTVLFRVVLQITVRITVKNRCVQTKRRQVNSLFNRFKDEVKNNLRRLNARSMSILPVLIRSSGIGTTLVAIIIVAVAPRGGVIINFHLLHHVFDNRLLPRMRRTRCIGITEYV